MNVEVYRKLLGRQVAYVKSGKVRTGTLLHIAFDDSVDAMVAHIDERRGFWKSLFDFSPGLHTVPLGQIQLPKNLKQESSSSGRSAALSSGSASSSRPQSQQTYIIHNQARFERCNLVNLQINEQVVWLVPERFANETTYVGIVKFIGKHEHVINGLEYVAVVEFDQNTLHLPNCCRFGGSNLTCNVINVDELVGLEGFVDSFPTSSPSSHQSSRPQYEEKIPQSETQNSNSPLEPELIDLTQDVSNVFCRSQEMPQSQTEDNNLSVPLLSEPEIVDLTEDVLNASYRPSNTDTSTDRSSTSTPQIDWQQPINLSAFLYAVHDRQSSNIGIQGYDDSCYLDASLTALFSFNHKLDDALCYKFFDKDETQEKVKAVLQTVVGLLRQDYFVSYARIRDLREIIAEDNPAFRKSYMDAEDFILTLLRLIGAPPLFEYENGVTEHVHQMLLPPGFEQTGKVGVLTVETLLSASFAAYEVRLLRPPDGLFILKLPVSEGVLIPCNQVIPDLILDLTKIVSPGCAQTAKKASFHLSAVICLYNKHFVSYIRTGKDVESPWIFMDSNPGSGKSKVMILYHMGKLLMGAVNALHHDGASNETEKFNDVPEEERTFFSRLSHDCYICIYEN